MAEEELYNLAFLKKISGGDEDFIREMITTFNEIAPEFLDKAKSYLDRGMIDALGKETHRFIPGVSFLGAKALEKELMYIEEFTKKNERLDEIPGLLESVEMKIKELIACFNRDFK
jgi:HPt (histidine-containing phosphotransfer) domain-containing protein